MKKFIYLLLTICLLVNIVSFDSPAFAIQESEEYEFEEFDDDYSE